MNIEDLDKKYLFTETEKQVLTFLNENSDDLIRFTIRDVANSCFTSPATIIKLAKKMNLSGYSAMIEKISVHPQVTISSDFIAQTGLVDAYSLLENKCADFKHVLAQFKEKKILILSTGFSENIANYFYEVLILRDFQVLRRAHLELIEPNQKGETLVIAISESGETTIVKDLVVQAAENNMNIISFTGNPSSTISKLATLDFSVDVYNGLSVYSRNEPKYFYGIAMIIFEGLIH